MTRRGRPQRDYDDERKRAEEVLDQFFDDLEDMESEDDFDIEGYFVDLTMERPALPRRTSEESE